jgi:hypothetical protein
LLTLLQESRSVLSVTVVSGLIKSADFAWHGAAPVPVLSKPIEMAMLLTMVEEGILTSAERAEGLVLA